MYSTLTCAVSFPLSLKYTINNLMLLFVNLYV